MAFSSTALSSGSRCASARANGALASPVTATRAGALSNSHNRCRCCSSAGQALTEEGEQLGGGNLRAGGVAAVAVLELTGLKSALPHHHAVRDPHQLRVGELDAGAGIAVVVPDLEPLIGELGIQSIADFADTG